MGREILFKAKSGVSGKWVEGLVFNAGNMQYIYTKPKSDGSRQEIYEVDPDTICQYTGLMDKNGKKIWENDILMCHDNPVDLVKAVFGEFNVIEAESEEVIDSVIGWHYETIPTDALSKCEPFCYSMSNLLSARPVVLAKGDPVKRLELWLFGGEVDEQSVLHIGVSDYGGEENMMEMNIPINYCPRCGKKL